MYTRIRLRTIITGGREPPGLTASPNLRCISRDVPAADVLVECRGGVECALQEDYFKARWLLDLEMDRAPPVDSIQMIRL